MRNTPWDSWGWCALFRFGGANGTSWQLDQDHWLGPRTGFKFWVMLGTGTGFAPTFGARMEDIEKLISCEMQPTKVPSFGCVCGHCGLIPLRRDSGVALPLFKLRGNFVSNWQKLSLFASKKWGQREITWTGYKEACAEIFNWINKLWTCCKMK